MGRNATSTYGTGMVLAFFAVRSAKGQASDMSSKPTQKCIRNEDAKQSDDKVEKNGLA